MRALEKMQIIQVPGFPPTAVYNKRRINSIEVRQSSLDGAGLGLFAKKNIKAGTIISFYPVHTIGIDFDGSAENRLFSIDSAGETQERRQEIEDDQAYLHNILGKRLLMNADIINTLGGQSIFIDVDLGQGDSPSFVSHRINDGAIVMENTHDGVLKYYQESRKAKNCVRIPFGPSPLLATVTTKKVSKGEELFTTYGCSYWLERLQTKGDAEDFTEMTDDIILEARDVAKDVMISMQSAALTNAAEANELCKVFDS